jgi:hypothetical protein
VKHCAPSRLIQTATSTDYFYPNFIAKLQDDRILAVEYKGEYLASNDDTKEKKALAKYGKCNSTKKACSCLLSKIKIGRILNSKSKKRLNLYKMPEEIKKKCKCLARAGLEPATSGL